MQRSEMRKLLTFQLSRFDEFVRENLGAGILGGAGTLQVENLHLLCRHAISIYCFFCNIDDFVDLTLDYLRIIHKI